MTTSTSVLLLLVLILSTVSATSLLNQLIENARTRPKHVVQSYDNQLADDDNKPPKSLTQIGTFRGKPIIGRQNNVYIDDNGIPVPIPQTSRHHSVPDDHL